MPDGTDRRSRIAIVDPCCPVSYDPDALSRGGLGGTEATILRVASALTHGFDLRLLQKRRREGAVSGAGHLLPFSEENVAGADAAIVVNSWKLARRLRHRYPLMPLLLWLHVHPGRHNRAMGQVLAEAGIGVVCVSRSHASSFRAFLGSGRLPDIAYIPNPIADDLRPDATPRDPNLLLFASSPHKGLSEVYVRFRQLRDRLPTLRLEVADPGYLRWDVGPVPDGTVLLGPLPHADLIARMRHALCLFYPQTTFAETFGLVLAEANAVGTPVLVHRGLGANDEVVHGSDQAVHGHDIDAMLERILLWRSDPPRVSIDPDFRLARVAERWREVLATLVETGRLAQPALRYTHSTGPDRIGPGA